MPKNKTIKVVLGVSGSVAAYKAGDLIRRLQDQGCDVTVVMTANAQRFITSVTLGALSGNHVYVDMFEADAWRMAHIELARNADVVLIAPATANVISKIACGLADDLLTTFALTTRAPVLIAPAMNDEMYANVAVQNNCALLKKRGIKFIDPIKGKLACGVEGIGHLAAVDDIVKKVMLEARGKR